MIEKIFNVTAQSNSTSLGDTLAYMLAAVVLGFLISGIYIFITEKTRRSFSFIISLVMLPAIVSVVIGLVGSDVARAFSIAGVFSLVRFRSAPGESKDISLVFLTMAAGLATGLGYLTLAFAVTLILGLIIVVGFKVIAKCVHLTEKQLRILIPEDMNYQDAFDDLFETYTKEVKLVKVKTTNMGTLYELTYDVQMKNGVDEKKFMDELRCRNGNLNIILSYKEMQNERL